jgi:hypothetical protein
MQASKGGIIEIKGQVYDKDGNLKSEFVMRGETELSEEEIIKEVNNSEGDK